MVLINESKKCYTKEHAGESHTWHDSFPDTLKLVDPVDGFPNINYFQELMYREHKKLVTPRPIECPAYKVLWSHSDKYQLGKSLQYLTRCRFLIFCKTSASRSKRFYSFWVLNIDKNIDFTKRLFPFLPLPFVGRSEFLSRNQWNS